MGSGAIERRLAAILSADAVAYSRLMAEDEAATLRSLKSHTDRMGGLVCQHGGRVVDAVGDNLLAEFKSVVDAVACGMEMQRQLKKANEGASDGKKLEFRVGIHLDDVMVDGEQIYGDGVNIAARLEGLAEPGGICISGTVQEQVRKKLPITCEDLGAQSLKNISDPVHVFRVQPARDTGAHESAKLTVPGFGGRPGIAVLPFENLSGDPGEDHFADGIVEDIITRLSTYRWFPVIARNSTFAYKGKSVDVKEVSRALGVRYVVEGSVRKAGKKLRINAQLIDATTGLHIWAERYDRELSDVFALQDEITEAIVGSIHPELWESERERAVRQEPRNLDAWECAQRAWWHMNRINKEDNAKARRLYEKAAELDPHLLLAPYGLAHAHYLDIIYHWSESLDRSVAELVKAAHKCVALDDKAPAAHLALGLAYSVTGESEKMIAAVEHAVHLNPSFSLGYFYLGVFLGGQGRHEEALANFEKAIRLSPQDRAMWLVLYMTSISYYQAGQCEEAVQWAKRSLKERPDLPFAYRSLAMSYAQLGRIEDGRMALDECNRLNPEFSLACLRTSLSGAAPRIVDRIIEGLRKAGWKE